MYVNLFCVCSSGKGKKKCGELYKEMRIALASARLYLACCKCDFACVEVWKREVCVLLKFYARLVKGE
jgi:hypothetical protein